jgi:hypothetical protein
VRQLRANNPSTEVRYSTTSHLSPASARFSFRALMSRAATSKRRDNFGLPEHVAQLNGHFLVVGIDMLDSKREKLDLVRQADFDQMDGSRLRVVCCWRARYPISNGGNLCRLGSSSKMPHAFRYLHVSSMLILTFHL